MERKIRRGDIFYANLDPVVGSEQGGERPVLIIQNDKGNQHSPTVIVAAVTSRVNKKNSMPTHIPIECTALAKDSIALLEQIRTIDKQRLTEYVGKASSESMEKIDKSFLLSVGVKV